MTNLGNKLVQAYYSATLNSLSSVPKHVAEYLNAHVINPESLPEHFRTYQAYKPFLKGPVLDWGSAHAPDALFCSDEFVVHACDVTPGEWFARMHAAANVTYTRLHHPFQLPYGNEEFGAVISHGTLEHVPLESRSMDEVWRVLKIGGVFVVACMPQRFSVLEWLNRRLGRPHHKRRHTRVTLRRLMLAHGFVPVLMRAHYSRPLCLQGLLAALWPEWIERVPGLRALTQNLLCIAVKVHGIGVETVNIEGALEYVDYT